MVMNKAMEPNANHVVNSVNLASDEKNANRDFNPEMLGREFVRQYYTMLNECPQNLFRFYSDNSSLIHGNEPGESVTPAYGQHDINKKLMSLNFRDCHTKIRQVDSLETVNKSVVIQVIGELSNNGQPMRRFFQSFILASKSPTHYYVRNDIFRYQDEVFVDDDEGYTEENLVEDNNHVIENSTIDATNSAASAVVLNSSLVVSAAAAAVIHSSQPLAPSKASAANNGDKLNGQLSDPEKLSASEHLDRTKPATGNKFSCMNPEISPINAVSAPSADASEHLETTDDHSDSEQSIESKFKPVEKAPPTDGKADVLVLSGSDEPLKSDQEGEIGVSVLVQQQEKQNEPRTYATMVQKKFGSLSNSSSTAVVNSIDKNKDGQLIKSNEESLVNTVLSNNLVTLGKKDEFPSEWTFESASTTNETSSHSAQSEKRNGRDHSDEQQVFVGNLPQNIDENQLRDYFIKYGDIVDVRICQKGGKTPNYGFITFSDNAVVKRILAKKPLYFDHHRINVEEKKSGRSSGGFGGRRDKDKESSSKFGSSNGSGSLSAFHMGGSRASDRGRFSEKRKGASGSTNSNNSGNSRAQQSTFRR